MSNATKLIIANDIKVPFMQIKFPLDTSVYRIKEQGLERIPNTYVKRNIQHEVVKIIDEGIYLLTTGEIVKSERNNRPTIHHGKLVVLNNDVKVYSPNGIYIRTLMEDQIISVNEIGNSFDNKRYYKISPKEIVLEQPNVMFLKGYYQPIKRMTLSYDGKPFVLEPQEKYSFDDVENSFIRLTSHKGKWLDVSLYPGKLQLI